MFYFLNLFCYLNGRSVSVSLTWKTICSRRLANWWYPYSMSYTTNIVRIAKINWNTSAGGTTLHGVENLEQFFLSSMNFLKRFVRLFYSRQVYHASLMNFITICTCIRVSYPPLPHIANNINQATPNTQEQRLTKWYSLQRPVYLKAMITFCCQSCWTDGTSSFIASSSSWSMTRGWSGNTTFAQSGQFPAKISYCEKKLYTCRLSRQYFVRHKISQLTQKM